MQKKKYDEGLVGKICPTCGKEFFPTPDHKYKDYINGKSLKFCKWSCLCAARRKFGIE